MEYEAFILSPLYKPLLLAEEDQPQDEKEWKRLVNLDRQRQYETYMRLQEPAGFSGGVVSDEEKRVLDKLSQLTKKNLSGGVGVRTTDQGRGLLDTKKKADAIPHAQTFDRTGYQREYMRKWRAKQKTT